MYFTFNMPACIKFSITLLWLVSATCGNAKPQVVSSIKPLQLLVTAVAGDLVDSQLLLPATVSPHLYHLRPSDRRLIQSADLVVWIGPDLERFLMKTLAQLPHNQIIALGDGFEDSKDLSQNKPDGHDKYTGDNHSHNRDPHFWLNPLYATDMARKITDRLIDIDPDHSVRYQQNWERFQQRINHVDNIIREGFQSIGNSHYIVLHDGYKHFEQRYGLNHIAALSVGPDRKPGVKRMLEINEAIKSSRVRCMFREPQYQLGIEKILLGSGQFTLGLLDPLASTTPVSESGYEDFMLSFSSEFQRCIAQ